MPPDPGATLAQIPPDLLDSVWPVAEPFLRRACDRMGFGDPERFRQRAHAGMCDLWLVYAAGHCRAAFITSVRGTTFTIECLGGERLGDWLWLIAELERMAADHGKTNIEIEGRPGWAGVLPGYRTERVVLVKELAHGA